MNTSANRVEATRDFRPEYWAVYAIEDKALGFFAGYKPFGPPCVPMFCNTLENARLFDTFKDGLDARIKALAIRDYSVYGATVWAYRRCELLPEQYKQYGDSK